MDLKLSDFAGRIQQVSKVSLPVATIEENLETLYSTMPEWSKFFDDVNKLLHDEFMTTALDTLGAQFLEVYLTPIARKLAADVKHGHTANDMLATLIPLLCTGYVERYANSYYIPSPSTHHSVIHVTAHRIISYQPGILVVSTQHGRPATIMLNTARWKALHNHIDHDDLVVGDYIVKGLHDKPVVIPAEEFHRRFSVTIGGTNHSLEM